VQSPEFSLTKKIVSRLEIDEQGATAQVVKPLPSTRPLVQSPVPQGGEREELEIDLIRSFLASQLF
jgi:hypothetical protein